jgi:hypothetical protein
LQSSAHRLTGSPAPLITRVAHALQLSAKNIFGNKNKIVLLLDALQQRDSIAVPDLMEWIVEFQDALAARNYKGIIFTIDELGKFLEYEARHYGANDIYLLQALAEHACKGHKVNLLLFVLLHQSFEQYAKGLGENLKKEWSKVQGRFEEIPFLESAEQILRVVSAAFSLQLTKAESKVIEQQLEPMVQVLLEQAALPSGMTLKEAKHLFAECYPLHPVSAMLLPLLCQRIAQNERTLFSYLGSQEPNGFTDLLRKLEFGQFIQPHHIYDYFIANQQAIIGDHFTHRRWVEVLTALERLGDAPAEISDLLKTIGLLNIIGAKGGLKASKELLPLCFDGDAKGCDKVIATLTKKSCINYRKFNGEYRVWQGSDFELEKALHDELGKLGNFSLSEALAARKAMLPVVVRRYTIENGTLRYFQPLFIDARSWASVDREPRNPSLIFYLSNGQDDEKLYHDSVKKNFSDRCITVLCRNGSQLREATAEVLALRQVQISCQELNSDPVAKREFDDRLSAAEAAEDELLHNLLEYPADSEWHYQGKLRKITNKRELQEAFSEILKSIYKEAPILSNELINREQPSSQANAARNKLLYAMLYHSAKPDLGIDVDKFPPEKAIYRSLLFATSLHVETKSGWKFVAPEANNDRFQIYPAWQAIDRFLEGTENEAKSFADLNKVLSEPPYGIKAGVLPILYIAAFVVYQHELAFYENRVYKPYFTEEMLERFVKRPDEFTFQRFRIKGVRASLFKEYSKVLLGNDNKNSLLDIAKALATEIGRLPEYTQRTEQGLSKQARDVRMAFNLAKSPERLLLKDIPLVLGFDELEAQASEETVARFSLAFTNALRELRSAHQRLLDRQCELLAGAFQLSNTDIALPELRKVLMGRYHGMENFTVDVHGVRAFVMRLTKTLGSDEDWLEGILSFLGHKPSKKWLDSDQGEAEHRLAKFSQNLKDLEQLRIYEERLSQRGHDDVDMYMLRSFKKGKDFRQQVVAIDKSTHARVEQIKIEILEKLDKQLKNKEARLAALAEIVEDFFDIYDGKGKQNTDDASVKPATRGKQPQRVK